MLKFLKKFYPILIAILVTFYYSSDLKQNFKKIKLETENSNGINLTISTNWFEIIDGGHNQIQIKRSLTTNNSGIMHRSYYFGENRNERIDNIINIEWQKNDSLIIIHTKLKNMEKRIDSLFWLKNN